MRTFNVCIVGGGSTFTLGFLKSFVRLKEEFPLKKLVLFDMGSMVKFYLRKDFRSWISLTQTMSRKLMKGWISYLCRCAPEDFRCVQRMSTFR